jgi:hypothetical protein
VNIEPNFTSGSTPSKFLFRNPLSIRFLVRLKTSW